MLRLYSNVNSCADNLIPASLTKVEVLFDWPWNVGPHGAPAPGNLVQPFSIAIAIGTATSLASYLTTIFAVKLNLLESAADSGPEVQKSRLLVLG